MTVQFEDFKSEIVARLVGDLIYFVRLASVIGTLITDFERGLFDGQLTLEGKSPRWHRSLGHCSPFGYGDSLLQ
jgi:hypothetical protein